MRKMVGGEKITSLLVLKIVDYMNSMPGFKRECYGWGETSNGEIFLIYNSKSIVTAVTFYLDEFTQNGKPFYLFKAEEIGFANISVYKRSHNVHIDYIKVLDKYQSLGIGKQLLSYIESYSKIKGCKTVTLDCLSTYTDGKNVLPFRNGKADKEKLKQMKIGSLKVVDKNMQFYLEADFKKQKNRKPLNDYLTPMIKNNLKLRPIKIKTLMSFVHLQLTRKPFEPMHLSQSSMNALKRFTKNPKHTAFDINATRQL